MQSTPALSSRQARNWNVGARRRSDGLVRPCGCAGMDKTGGVPPPAPPPVWETQGEYYAPAAAGRLSGTAWAGFEPATSGAKRFVLLRRWGRSFCRGFDGELEGRAERGPAFDPDPREGAPQQRRRECAVPLCGDRSV
ncbi:hypothetical protein AAFF_G00140750 [Aldrovandia affinis]|uniref:Uncharacterized protein n=1 Tax=Aldrovandia affinis TaxID=143900 RepID=A0AAD7TCF5_9TELE|nr:hypothetical protein AAFF_G00140750 [Aldrovandia affinis]